MSKGRGGKTPCILNACTVFKLRTPLSLVGLPVEWEAGWTSERKVQSSVLMRGRDPFQCTAVLTLVIMAVSVCGTHDLLYGGEYEDDLSSGLLRHVVGRILPACSLPPSSGRAARKSGSRYRSTERRGQVVKTLASFKSWLGYRLARRMLFVIFFTPSRQMPG
jgi:hypothetical protein